jgi:hypothetical protein
MAPKTHRHGEPQSGGDEKASIFPSDGFGKEEHRSRRVDRGGLSTEFERDQHQQKMLSTIRWLVVEMFG